MEAIVFTFHLKGGSSGVLQNTICTFLDWEELFTYIRSWRKHRSLNLIELTLVSVGKKYFFGEKNILIGLKHRYHRANASIMAVMKICLNDVSLVPLYKKYLEKWLRMQKRNMCRTIFLHFKSNNLLMNTKVKIYS